MVPVLERRGRLPGGHRHRGRQDSALRPLRRGRLQPPGHPVPTRGRPGPGPGGGPGLPGPGAGRGGVGGAGALRLRRLAGEDPVPLPRRPAAQRPALSAVLLPLRAVQRQHRHLVLPGQPGGRVPGGHPRRPVPHRRGGRQGPAAGHPLAAAGVCALRGRDCRSAALSAQLHRRILCG